MVRVLQACAVLVFLLGAAGAVWLYPDVGAPTTIEMIRCQGDMLDRGVLNSERHCTEAFETAAAMAAPFRFYAIGSAASGFITALMLWAMAMILNRTNDRRPAQEG